MSKQKKILFIVLSLVPSALIFLCLEGYTRYTRPKRNLLSLTGQLPGPHPMRQWAMIDAFSAFKARPGNYGDSTDKTVNSHGFISTPEISKEKTPGVTRIVFLGGSSTAGTGTNLSDTDTWPWKTVDLLNNKLTRINKKVDFINAALGGYTSFETYGRLWSRIRFFSPDIIILNHGWNEMYYFMSVDKITAWRTRKDGTWGFHNLKSNPIMIYEPLFFDELISPSQFLTYLRLKLSNPVSGEVGHIKELEPTFDHRGLAIWRSNLRLIRDTARILGAHLLVLKQATLITSNLPDSEKSRCRYGFHGFDHEAHVQAFNEIYQIIDDEIPAADIIDTKHLSGIPENFHDHVHPTPEGTTRIAETVSKKLLPILNKKFSNRG